MKPGAGHNDLSVGRLCVDGRRIAISDIRAPIFSVGTENDHVAPWRSVFKIHLLADTDVTFLLTSGGHNAGIVSELGHPRRRYRMAARAADDRFIAPDDWIRDTPAVDGSWWPAWSGWLSAQSDEGKVTPPLGDATRGAPTLDPAPGLYVRQR